MIISIIGSIIAGSLLFYSGYLFGIQVAAAKMKAQLKAYSDKVAATMIDVLKEVAKERELKKDPSKSQKIKEAFQLLEDVNVITQRQMDIMASIDGPSKGAAFSRWRNGVIQELKQLEEDKMAKLQSILDMGLDPRIKVVVDGVETKRKLSEVMSEYTATADPKPLDTKAKKPTFSLVKNDSKE